MYTFFLGALMLIIAYLSCMVLLVQIKKDTSIANFTWGGGCMFLAVYSLIVFGNYGPLQILTTALIIIWAIRMIVHLYLRYTRKDPRFESWKQEGIKALFINIGYIFFLQLLLLLIMSIPTVLVNMSYPARLCSIQYIGLLVWIIGFIFEAISDYQLYAFLKNPANKDKVMRYGLWRYSRHPNYFGEVVLWFGIFLIAIAVPYGYMALIAPITITFLLLFVTGVPMLEKAMANNPEYQEYKERTSIFIPWLVR